MDEDTQAGPRFEIVAMDSRTVVHTVPVPHTVKGTHDERRTLLGILNNVGRFDARLLRPDAAMNDNRLDTDRFFCRFVEA